MIRHLSDVVPITVTVGDLILTGAAITFALGLALSGLYLLGRRSAIRWYDRHWLAYVDWRTRETFYDLRQQATRAGKELAKTRADLAQSNAKLDMIRGITADSDWRIESLKQSIG